MSEIVVLNSKFEKAGSLNSTIDLSAEMIHESSVHQVVKATLAGRRQGTACTKTKGFVSGGGKKPFKQKGTGRARQGSNRSSLMVGGGTAFGPVPRDYTQKINKKVAKKALQAVLADKLNAGKLVVLDKVVSSGKSKEMYSLLSSKNLLPALLVTADADNKALMAVRNLQYGAGLPVDGFSVYEAVKYENLVIEKAALEKLLERLGQ